jgi:aerobic C4-dicarboxylate transport protein
MAGIDLASLPVGADLKAATNRSIWSNLGFQVFIAMVLGAVVGFLFPDAAVQLKILGDIFLRLVKTAVAPLVFLTVTLGVVSAGDLKRVGKIGLIAVIYFEIVSTLALVIGFAGAHVLEIGKGVAAANAAAGTKAPATPSGATHSATEFILNVFPDNFIGAFAKGELLQVLVVSLIFGAALLHLTAERRPPIERGLNTISVAFFEFIHIVMKLAPIGTFGAVAYAVGSSGWGVLLALIYLVLSFYAIIILFIVVVMGLIARIFGFSLLKFLRYIRDEISVVFGTASSESGLPRLLEKLQRLGCSKQSVGLVLPTGYAFNLDGTAIYMTMGTIFIANAYGIALEWHQIAGLLGVMLLTSKGAATVSGGTFVVFAATVTTTGILPLEGLPLMFGVYPFMSMINAVCNTVGNCVATIVVSKICGAFDPEAARAEYHRALDTPIAAHL